MRYDMINGLCLLFSENILTLSSISWWKRRRT